MGAVTQDPGHILTYPAELNSHIVVHSIHDGAPDRLIPAGTIVTVIENIGEPPRETLHTMVIMLSGVYYARDLDPDGHQFTRL